MKPIYDQRTGQWSVLFVSVCLSMAAASMLSMQFRLMHHRIGCHFSIEWYIGHRMGERVRERESQRRPMNQQQPVSTDIVLLPIQNDWRVWEREREREREQLENMSLNVQQIGHHTIDWHPQNWKWIAQTHTHTLKESNK